MKEYNIGLTLSPYKIGIFIEPICYRFKYYSTYKKANNMVSFICRNDPQMNILRISNLN